MDFSQELGRKFWLSESGKAEDGILGMKAGEIGFFWV